MARPTSVILTRREMDVLANALDLLEKIRRGALTDEPIIHARRQSTSEPGGQSDIVRHRNAAGFHIATSHRITTAKGDVPHWHVKDLRAGDVLIRYDD